MSKFTLNGSSDPVQIGCLNSGSGTITVQGNFLGEILVQGSSFPDSPPGGRLLFKTGVGSIGSNVITGYGDGALVEYRIVTGGGDVIFTPQNWVSGAATLTFKPDPVAAIGFVNGPVHGAEEESVRNKRSYLASTGMLSVQATEALFVTLSNPAESGRNMYLENRIFSSTATISLEYKAYGNPTAVLSQTAAVLNRFVGADSAVMECKYQVATGGTVVMGGTEGSGDTIPANGIPREWRVLVVVTPGNSLGFEIKGSGNNIGQAARLGVTFEWYEEGRF